MSCKNRYQNYGCAGEVEKTCHHQSTSTLEHPYHSLASQPLSGYHTTAGTNGMRETNGRTSYSSRLEYIVNSMAYIRGELDDLKESDRVLLDIFKQLESNVEELSDNISSWRLSGSFTPGRPSSFADIDYSNFSSTSSFSHRPPHSDHHSSEGVGPGVGGVAYTMNSLETILDSSKEDVTSLKEDNETDSGLVPESSSISCSPVLPSVTKFHHCSSASVRSSSSGAAAKRSSDVSPQLRMSTSFNKLANSPSISRLQDDGESTMSRNSSIDSGIQFASEAENGSTNGVVEAAVPAPVAVSSEEDVRKSVGFADDIFAALGLK